MMRVCVKERIAEYRTYKEANWKVAGGSLGKHAGNEGYGRWCLRIKMC